MGPQRSLSSIIDEIRSQAAEVERAVERMRSANRHLTGSTGEAPTTLQAGSAAYPPDPPLSEAPPLMVQLNLACEGLNRTTSQLRDEITYFENHSETGPPPKVEYDKMVGEQAKLSP